MGNIVIYHKNGDTIQARATITKAEQKKKLMADDIINIEVGSPEVINFAIGDYLIYCGQQYTLNQMPTVKKNNAINYSYSLQFEGVQYELLDCAWLLPENTYGDSFTGNLKDFLNVLIENIQRTGSNWQLGNVVDDTEYKTLTYTNTNCLQVLQNLCSEYDLEFVINIKDGKRIINIQENVGDEFAIKFEYGRTGGAYKIERKTTSNKNVITRLYVFGSEKNLPANYRYSRLCLPNKEKNTSFLTDTESVNLFGVKESVKSFSDIFPARYGKVTKIDDLNKRVFFDNTMDFDINEKDEQHQTKWLIAGSTAKVQFNSGGLAGYSFELTEYDPTTQKFKIKTYTDANGLTFPNDTSKAFQIAVGDEYFLTDIRIPDSYVKQAEEKLKEEAQKYFDENCKPFVSYSIHIDPFFLQNVYNNSKLESEIFRVGDYINVFDFELELNKKLRISEFTRNLLNPYEFQVSISESVELKSTTQRIVSELKDLRNIVRENDITSADNARQLYLSLRELNEQVFDTEGNYYSEKIKPLSIETTMLSVGAKSQQFVLRDVLFEPNFNANENILKVSNGFLDHYTIEDNEVKIWNLQGNTFDKLNPNTSYYIYAKCDKESDNGIFTCETLQHKFNEDPNFYYFLCGVLSTPIFTRKENNIDKYARNLALTYGYSTINGKFIRTGRIESNDGKVYIDLDTNEIGGATFNFTSGIISEAVWIGDSKESAIAGIGGGEMLLYAGKLPAPTPFGQYIFMVKKDGRLIVQDNYGNPIILAGGGETDRHTSQFMNITMFDKYYKKNISRSVNSTITLTQINSDTEIFGNVNIKNGVSVGQNIKCLNKITTYNLKVENPITATCNFYGNKFAGTIPIILWHGTINVLNARADRSYSGNNASGFSFGIVRERQGLLKIVFNQPFDKKTDYTIIANGYFPYLVRGSGRSTNFWTNSKDNKARVAYVTIVEKRADYCYLAVSDDESLNDYDIILTIMYVGGYISK